MRRPVTQPRSRSLRRPRATFVVAVGFLLLAPLGLVPGASAGNVAVAAPSSARVDAVPPRDGGSLDAGSDLDQPGDPAAGPSVHYRNALEHACDVSDFEPGARATVPFAPR